MTQTIPATSHGRQSKVAEINEIPEGGSKIINLEGRSVALFKIKNQYFAISNNCLHRGGPLGEGEVRNYEVTCPWHGWKFNLIDGAFWMIPTLKVKTFRVHESTDGVYIEF
ncbi:Rieske (2Fe-2S) protein [Candidatus Bathyarchaeota archaeon]|nr:Rieske (2Fe-2S) protein [Candidatus Bathyarchaeota archaeon]